MTHPEISLECQFDPSWEDAKTRLRVAAEILDFPFYIVIDEAPTAYKRKSDYVLPRTLDGSPEAAERFWDMASVLVSTMDEALSAIHPWYHGGEEL